MNYKIFYHFQVKKDCEHLDKNIKERIINTIEARLSAQPQKYGKPLRKPLAGYWKLRIGIYRVVFKILKDEVWVFAILPRNKIYKIALSRKRIIYE